MSTASGSIELLYDKTVATAYGRTLEASLKFTKCDITGEETWCVCVDTSNGEYGDGRISINYINEILERTII
jgi:hypothetical protein